MSLEARVTKGYGLTIFNDGERDICAFVDGSPVLVPSRIERDGSRRRFRFTEGSREIRARGDIFCADSETSGFVREAINEKIQRDSDAANAFRIVAAKASRRQSYLFMHITTVRVHTGDTEAISFTLEAPSYEVQQDGQREVGAFLDALGRAFLNESDELLGLTATFEIRNGERVYKKWKPE